MIYRWLLGRWRDEWVWIEPLGYDLPTEISFVRALPRAFCTMNGNSGPVIRSTTLSNWNEPVALELGDRVAIANNYGDWTLSSDGWTLSNETFE